MCRPPGSSLYPLQTADRSPCLRPLQDSKAGSSVQILSPFDPSAHSPLQPEVSFHRYLRSDRYMDVPTDTRRGYDTPFFHPAHAVPGIPFCTRCPAARCLSYTENKTSDSHLAGYLMHNRSHRRFCLYMASPHVLYRLHTPDQAALHSFDTVFLQYSFSEYHRSWQTAYG